MASNETKYNFVYINTSRGNMNSLPYTRVEYIPRTNVWFGNYLRPKL